MTTTDPRIDAAARGIWRWHEDVAASNTPEPTDSDVELAIAALAAADAVDPLRQPGHRAEISGFTWTLQHPAECRPDLLACPLTDALLQRGVSDIEDGLWSVDLGKDDGLLQFNPEADL